ncbi:hypothetical protein H1P_490003 [Hyella patelloides LEGE 07179]|uniref:Uncharacterized protein n=1 Tax=Hyella patelloides LEGE 07179 TaxID=945734 RepID=A0A563VZ60_9CYAN|nr:hypothetical protein H1P_490003 [Hyella patelloides LEGE 07179]
MIDKEKPAYSLFSHNKDIICSFFLFAHSFAELFEIGYK